MLTNRAEKNLNELMDEITDIIAKHADTDVGTKYSFI